MSDYLEGLEADVIAAAKVLRDERYYEYTGPLMEMIRQCKHYQRLVEFQISGISGSRELGKDRAELDRATETCDWYRYDG